MALARDDYLPELRAALLRHPEYDFEDWAIHLLHHVGYLAMLRWAPTFCIICYEVKKGERRGYLDFLCGDTCRHREFARSGSGGPYSLLPEDRQRLLAVIQSWEEAKE